MDWRKKWEISTQNCIEDTECGWGILIRIDGCLFKVLVRAKTKNVSNDDDRRFGHFQLLPKNTGINVIWNFWWTNPLICCVTLYLLVVGYVDNIFLDEAEVGPRRSPGDLQGGVVEGGDDQVLWRTREQIWTADALDDTIMHNTNKQLYKKILHIYSKVTVTDLREYEVGWWDILGLLRIKCSQFPATFKCLFAFSPARLLKYEYYIT